MKFVRVALTDACSHVLGQNVSHGGRRLVRKGVVLGAEEIERLQGAGITRVYVAQLSPSDVGEEEAARLIGQNLQRVSRGSVAITPLHGGRVSLTANVAGVCELNRALLLKLNCLRGVALATLPEHTPVGVGQLLATLKIIPFAIPSEVLQQALELVGQLTLKVEPWRGFKVFLLVTAQAGREDKLVPAFRRALAQRLVAWGNPPFAVRFVALGEQPERALATAISDCLQAGAEMVLLAGETATMDADDVGPRAIAALGGSVVAVGAPVYPGNLLLLGSCQGRAVVGMPGCVRSPDLNVVDLILPRLLAGQSLSREDIAYLGCGGLVAPARAIVGNLLESAS